MQVRPVSGVDSQLGLSLDDYAVSGGSIGHSLSGTTFTVTIGPISDATVAALDEVVRKQGRICLYCCREPLLFDLVTVERKEPLKARIVGRIFAPTRTAVR
jgi:hypothetical protein